MQFWNVGQNSQEFEQLAIVPSSHHSRSEKSWQTETLTQTHWCIFLVCDVEPIEDHESPD